MTNQAEPVKRLSTLAQLVQMYAECKGVSSTKQLAEIIGVSERAIRKAKAELSFPGTSVPRNVCSAGTGTYVPPPGTIVPPEPEQKFRPEPRAPARIETPSGLLIPKIVSNPPFTPQGYDAERVQRDEKGRLSLCDELQEFWLEQFDGDKPCLALALVQAAGYVKPNGVHSLESQVGSQLARIARERRERAANYQRAVAVKQRKTAGPTVAELLAMEGRDVH